jgi:hypothetical protein
MVQYASVSVDPAVARSVLPGNVSDILQRANHTETPASILYLQFVARAHDSEIIVRHEPLWFLTDGLALLPAWLLLASCVIRAVGMETKIMQRKCKY